MPSRKPSAKPPGQPPAAFKIEREIAVGRHPILEVFPGLDALGTAARLEPDVPKRRRLFQETAVEIVDQDVWMYVAPTEVPAFARRQWKPVVSPDQDCIVAGAGHLRTSPATMVFMDIFHELCHLRQRRDGANLWEPNVSYVERWTEVEAYRFVVDEARRFRVSDEFLRDYLKVEWISEKEHGVLLKEMKVPIA